MAGSADGTSIPTTFGYTRELAGSHIGLASSGGVWIATVRCSP